MKNKKIFFIIPLLLTSCAKDKITIYLGEIINSQDNFIEALENNFSCSINNEFASTKFYMKSFYNMLEKDALNLTTNNSINNLLENSNRIILNIGNYELIRLISYTENNISYNEEILKTSLEMFEYYLHQSLETLTSYCTNIFILPLYNSLILNEETKKQYNYLINQYNEIIYNNCNEFQIKYISIDKLSYFVYKENNISSTGITYLIKQINQYESS